MQMLLTQALSQSSTEAYRKVWCTFNTFCQDYALSASFPVPISTVALFVAHQFSANYASSTITSHLSAIGYIHKLLNLPDPTGSFVIQKMLHAARKIRPAYDTRLPITKSILHRLITALDHTSTSNFRRKTFKAMFLLAFHAFLRVGEITHQSSVSRDNIITLAQVNLTGLPATQVSIAFLQYKHSQGTPFHLTIRSQSEHAFCPVHNLIVYLELRGNTPGPLFAYPSGSPITRNEFCQELQRALRFTNLDISRYTSHSFRLGASTEAAGRGLSDAQIRQLGRWKSDAFKGYIRAQTRISDL
jgi:integrase